VTDAHEVRPAGPEDVEEIVDILSEAARWLLARGIRQWPDPFPGDRIAAFAERGVFQLVSLGGETVATLALLWSDPAFWGVRPPDAGYVHALAVRRAHAGQGLGGRLLDWADEQVAAAGREYLRLDCRADNAQLCRYYERHCFEPRGEVVVDDFTSALYERRCRVRSDREKRVGGEQRMGESGTRPARSGHEHVRLAPVGSQRERRWPSHPTQEGGRALGD
jgi:ribosomal protein S18 acetylase RimI-like enzyme